MRYFLFLVSLSVLSFSSCDSKPEVTQEGQTTYYLIRHAEKDRSNPENRNPDLTREGQQRAQNWSNLFKDIPLDAVYATNYNRTQQTAAPTAQQKGLDVQSYDPTMLYDLDFQKATKGKKVLVVGHSNTTPQFVNAIIAQERYGDIDDSNNGNLYIVHLKGDQSTVELLHID